MKNDILNIHINAKIHALPFFAPINIGESTAVTSYLIKLSICPAKEQ